MIAASTALFIGGGLALLVLGGHYLVRGAASLAKRLGVSRLLIGLLFVGFGTSVPELVTSIQAARTGAPGLVLGNVIGSNLANILLIIGLAAVIAPLTGYRTVLYRDLPVLGIFTGITFYLAYQSQGTLGATAGWVMVGGLATYILFAYLYDLYESRQIAANKMVAEESDPEPDVDSVALSILFSIIGFAVVIAGAVLIVDGAVEFARVMEVSELVIGATILAVGTSLPELATTIVAAMRDQSKLALGSIIGSCIFNLFGILGLTALWVPIAIPSYVVFGDFLILAAATGFFTLFVFTGRLVSRFEGSLLLVGYFAYIGFLVYRAIG